MDDSDDEEEDEASTWKEINSMSVPSGSSAAPGPSSPTADEEEVRKVVGVVRGVMNNLVFWR